MATPNYGYEKRQKELAKKRKKEDKLKDKNERKLHGPEEEPSQEEAAGQIAQPPESSQTPTGG